MANHSANINSLFGISIAAPTSGAAYRNYSLAAGVVVAPMQADGKRYHSFSDLKGVQEMFGSNSVASRLATAWFSGGFAGVKPRQFGIITVDANNNIELAAGTLTYSASDNAFTLSDADALTYLSEQTTAGTPVYVDITVGTAGTQALYAKVVDGKVKFYVSKAAYATDTAVDFSAEPYELSDGDATATAIISKDALADALMDITSSSEYYWLVIDPNFTQEQSLMIMSAISTLRQGSSYLAVFLDQDTKCWELNHDDDTETLMAKAYNYQYRNSAVVYADAANINEMQHASFLSFFGILSDSTEIGTADVKTMSGLTANKTSKDYSTDDQPGQDNIGSNPNNPVGKNGNVFSNYTNFGTCFRYGTTASGDEIGRIVLEEWLVNRMLVNLWNWRINAKSAKYTTLTQDALTRCISAPLDIRVQTGDIVTGLSADEQYNLPRGYTVSVPMASATDRQQRVWTGITFAYLYGNSAKYFEVNGIGTI